MSSTFPSNGIMWFPLEEKQNDKDIPEVMSQLIASNSQPPDGFPNTQSVKSITAHQSDGKRGCCVLGCSALNESQDMHHWQEGADSLRRSRDPCSHVYTFMSTMRILQSTQLTATQCTPSAQKNVVTVNKSLL